MSESKQLRIETLDTIQKTIQGQQKDLWIVNGKWESFKGKWNAGWAIGGNAQGLFVENDYNGRIYYSIKCPPELNTGKGNYGNNQSNLMPFLEKIFQEILTCQKLIKGEVTETSAPTLTDVADPVPVSETPISTPQAETPISEPQPAAKEEEIQIEDIPF